MLPGFGEASAYAQCSGCVFPAASCAESRNGTASQRDPPFGKSTDQESREKGDEEAFSQQTTVYCEY
eukprot:COSAG02_NODE_8935_length_2393_cov_21.592851_1_plen_67_part_00